MQNNVTEVEVPIGFKIDIGEIQEDQYKEEVYNEDEYTEESLEDSTKDEDLDELEEQSEDESNESTGEDEDDNPYKEYSESAIIAISEIKDGTFEGLEEKDIPKDLDAVALRELYRKSKEITLKSEIERISAQAGEAARYVQFLLEGGDPAAVKSALEFEDLITLDIETEDNQKLILKADYERKGIDPDEIDDLVDNIIDKGKGKQKAAEIQKNLVKYQDEILKSYEEQEKQRRLIEQEQYEQTVTTVKQLIDKGEVNGVKIPKKEQKELFEAIFSPTEVIEVVNPQTGKPQKIRASKIQVLQQNLNSDPEKIISFYHWLLKGGNFNFIKQQAAEEEQDSLRSLLQGRKTSKTESKKSSIDSLAEALRRR